MIFLPLLPVVQIDHERLYTAKWINDIKHPINLRLFNWRVPALQNTHKCVNLGVTKIICWASWWQGQAVIGLGSNKKCIFDERKNILRHFLTWSWSGKSLPRFQIETDARGAQENLKSLVKRHNLKPVLHFCAFDLLEELFFCKCVWFLSTHTFRL